MQSFGELRPTTNPYIVLLRDSLMASGEVDHLPFRWRTALMRPYDVFHVHWPDTLLIARTPVRRAMKRLAFAALLARLWLTRPAVVRTVHNITAPKRSAIDGMLIRALERRTDLDIHLNETTPNRGDTPTALIRHGHYRDWFAPMPKKTARPGELAYVGLIRRYKGVDTLVEAFSAAVQRRPHLSLHVAGKASDPTMAASLATAQARVPHLAVTLRYISEEEFAAAVTGSCLVVLPYRHMHNSGSALAALSLNRPVLVPDNAANRDLAEEVGPGWVHLFQGELRADDLITVVDELDARPPSGEPDLSAREWTDTARQHVDAYRRAIAHRTPGHRAPDHVVPYANTRSREAVQHIVVGIPTFRRPQQLRAVLDSVQAQVRDVNAESSQRVRCSVLVVDNDPAASGRAVAEAADVRYVTEPRPGIAAVRNRAIAECADADAVLFIDDDEVPEPDWLHNITSTYIQTGADAVAGRVITHFPPTAEPWVAASGAFVRPTRRHYQSMREAATNNLVIDLQSVRSLGLAFDERFGLTGGSDSLFTRQLTDRGGEIRWCQDAVVVEQEDPARFTRKWVLMRTFRFGNSHARVNVITAHTPARRLAARVTTTARGAARVLAGSLRVAWGGATRSLPHRAHGLRTAYRGAGMIAGSIGYAYSEYGRRRKADRRA